MKTTMALILRFLATWAVAWIAFMLFGTVAFWTVLIIAVTATILNYLIGDLLLLSRIGNIWTSIIEGVIGWLAAWIILIYSPVALVSMTPIWIFAVLTACVGFFIHMYLLSAHIVEKKKSDSDFYKRNKPGYNTETGSDLFPYANKNNSESRFTGSSNNGYYKNENLDSYGSDYNSGDSDYNNSNSTYNSSDYAGGGSSGYVRGNKNHKK